MQKRIVPSLLLHLPETGVNHDAPRVHQVLIVNQFFPESAVMIHHFDVIRFGQVNITRNPIQRKHIITCRVHVHHCLNVAPIKIGRSYRRALPLSIFNIPNDFFSLIIDTKYSMVCSSLFGQQTEIEVECVYGCFMDLFVC